MTPPEPVYLPADSQVSSGMFHAPAPGAAPGAPVLLLPPWGWDDVASFRVRRAWAGRLADAGHPTLRLTLPGTGDAGGSPADHGLVAAWVESVKGAAGWLRARAGAGGVAAIGLGLGGLLGLEAVAGGAEIEQLVLWAAPAGGRRFVREAKAFSRMQQWSQAGEEAGGEPPLAAGAIEAGGFVLGAETVTALKGIEPKQVSSDLLRRVLLLDRDGVAVDPGLLEAVGRFELETRPGPGWERMTAHPETAVLPEQVVAEVESWLERGRSAAGDEDDAAGGARGEAPEAAPRLELAGSPLGVRETPISFEQDWGRAFGVLSEPLGAGAGELCLVLLNAGAVRHIGPNRMWAEAARAWSARGLAVLRVDLEGIGEADGSPSGALGISDFYDPRYIDQVRQVLDALAARTGARRFVLAGLCAGGYLSFRGAVEDERVEAAILVNAGALRWSDDLIRERDVRRARRVFERRSWRRALRGELAPARVLALLRSLAARALRLDRRAGLSSRSIPAGIEADLDALRESGTGVCVAFSSGEPLQHELRAAGLDSDDERWPLVRHRRLPGSDHTLRPLAAQAAFHRLLAEELGPLVATAGPGPAQPRESMGTQR